ncbi:MAG: secretin N-terminal domain-containing protein [Thermoguttaceae bacterium]|jgi:type II secretion system protein D
MLKREQTRSSFSFRRILSSDVKNAATPSYATFVVAIFVVLQIIASSALAQDASSDQYSKATSAAYGEALTGSSYGDVSARPSRMLASIGETTDNAQCVQRTFRAPQNQNAALIGTFILRLLPESLREQTSCRYSEDENLIIMYGPEKAIQLSENLLDNFSETLFEAFLTSGEFVSVAGVARERPIPSATDARVNSVGRNYYDPNRNDVVRVAYEPQGAIVPERQEYAVAFGSGADNPVQPSAQQDVVQNDVNRPTLESVLRQGSSQQEQLSQLSNEDSMLDVASYRCPPAACDRVAQLVERRFATNPAVAFSVDSQLGTIVVHTNRKFQREVRDFLATLQVYPARQSAYEADLRVMRGDVVPVDGSDYNATPLERSLNQVAPRRNDVTHAGSEVALPSLNDVYIPQTRKAEELQDSLLQLFGNRLARLPETSEVYSQRQITTYRFIKRSQTDGKGVPIELRTCEVSIDPLHNRIALQGDPRLCSQMLVLLRAMDQPPLRNGNVRRFIPLYNCDPSKLQQIFEYGAQKTVDSRGAQYNSFLVWRIADNLCRQNLPEFDRFSAETPISQRYASTLNSKIAPSIRATIDLALNKPSVVNPLHEAYAAIGSIDSLVNPNAGKIRQVAYQEGDLDDLGALISSPGSEFDPFDPLNDQVDVGVVQDFMPTVLQDLDVVIVDNATDAEFERIKQMIEQIEELAKIAEIQTEIYNLKYVDCAMLHGVLTTLYAEMFTTKQGRVVFYALQNPNALLVAGWGQSFDDIKTLIELFDKPVADGTGTYRVVRLKYASVDEISSLLTSTFLTPQTTGTGGFAPRIRVFADVRTNSLVIQASPNDWNEIQKLLLELDVNKAETKLMTRIFPLKNSLAEDIRTTIMSAILPAKQGTLDSTAAKFPILQLLSVDETGRRLVESGVMMDVDVSADVYHNQLIVSAPEDCMEFMERLIELLDVAPNKAQIRFFQIRHGDASQIIQTLQSLLATTDNNLSAPTLPQVEGSETFVPVRFALDTRTNVIIAAAAPKELAIVDALIVALDIRDTSERQEEVVQLRNIQALVVAEAIDSYLTQKQTLETASEVLSNYQLFDSQVIVIPESISNSIIVSASPEQMPKILQMIRKFDQDPAQVQIKVLIAEVTLTDQEQFGIESGLQNSTSFDRSTITTTSSGSSTGSPGFDIIGSNGPGKNMATDVDVTDIAGQVLNNFGMGATDSTLGYGGFVLSASSRSVAATLRALREKNRLQVLSCPQVTAMDNQQAFILVGQRVPRINGTTTTNYGVQMNTTDTPVGLILLVTPRVTKDGKVVMEIGAEKSSLGNDADAIPIYSQDGAVIKSRSIDTIQTMTAISAHDGETVMLGGLLTSEKKKISRGVPYVSDIPILGWFFRYDQEAFQRKELLIVMTPRIMRNPADFAEVMQREMGRTHVNLDEAMSLNGNMGLYDPCTDQGYQPRERHFLNDIVHPEKMDEFQNLPPYSPSNDYKPRPIIEDTDLGTTPSPYAAGISASESSSIGGSVVNRRFTSQPTVQTFEPANSEPEPPSVNEDFYIDDRFMNNSVPTNRADERQVAMRETDKVTAASLTQVSPSRQTSEAGSFNAANQRLQRASDLRTSEQINSDDRRAEASRKALGISPYRDQSDSTPQISSKQRATTSSEFEELAEARSSAGTTRGQVAEVENAYPFSLDPHLRIAPKSGFLSRLATAVPYRVAPETPNFKLFHWKKDESYDRGMTPATNR